MRIIRNWNLLLVEEGLGIYLHRGASPYDGYKLAADYCRHYESRYRNELNGPSRLRIEEIARFLGEVERQEGD